MRGVQIPIHTCSIADYSNGKADLAMAVFTVLSYIVNEEEMMRTFQTVANHLNPGGYFFFDLPDPVFFQRPILFDLKRTDLKRKVTIIPKGENQIFTYKEEGIVLWNGENLGYGDQFPIRQWDWEKIIFFLGEAGFQDSGRRFPVFDGYGSSYRLFKKV